MSSLQTYTKATAYIKGSLLAEEGKLSIKRISGAQVVKTVAKGFAGMSPGSPMMTLSFTNSVPSADFELNPGRSIQNLEVVEITIFAAGRTLTTNGIITEDNFSHAVDTPSELTFEATAQYADWQ